MAALALMTWLVMGGVARGQSAVATPLHIGATQPITDEFGATLKGNSASPGDLVQVLWASNSVIYPPAADGTPDPRNPLVEGAQTAIGLLTSDRLLAPGIFGVSVTGDERPGITPGVTDVIFARAFNARTLAAASFYGDSQLFTVSGNEVFDAVIGATTNPLDAADNDSDGLNNSWEKSYGTDPNNPDTDGDRMKDGDELRAGTDFLDPDSLFIIAQAWPAGNDIGITWDAVPGKRYRVQIATNDLTVDPQEYADCSGVVTAATGTAGTTITNGMLESRGHFRVMLVESESP